MAETKQTISAREKWQQEVAATLQSDAITSGMFVNEMKQSFNSQNQFWAQQVQLSSMSNTLLESIEKNTFRTADLFEKYIDDFKDAARRQAEAALEASRKKDTKGGGKDIENLGGLDLDFGTITAGLIGGVGVAALGFKDKIVNFFKKTETGLKDLDKPKKGFFDGIKKFLGFGPTDVEDINLKKTAFYDDVGKFLKFGEPDIKDVDAKKLSFKDKIGKFLKFGETDVASAGVQKTQFKNALNRQLAWAADAEKLSDASKIKFLDNQKMFLKWSDDAIPNTLFAKSDFLYKQKELLKFAATADPDSAKAKMKFIDDQAKFLKFAEDAPTKTLDQKKLFLKSIGDSLDIPAGNIDASKIAKDSFFKKQLDLLNLKPEQINGVELRKAGLFEKMKTKIFSFGEGVVDGVVGAKNTFSTKMSNFFKLPMFDEGSALMKVKSTFLNTLDKAMGILLKVTKGFFKLVNILNFGALDYLNPEALRNPMKTFESFKGSMNKTFGPKDGILTKAANLFKSIIAPLDDIIKPLKDILKFVGKIAKVVGRIFIPIGFLFSAFDVISNIVEGYKEGGITGAIGAGIESIFDDVLFAIPNLLGEAVAWLLDKFGFENATAFIDKNLRDKDGNFSIFNGIKTLLKNVFSSIGQVFNDLMDAFSLENILVTAAAFLIKEGGALVKGALDFFMPDAIMEKAQMKVDDPEGYAKMRQAEIDQKKLERELERQKAAAAQASLVQDNSQTIQKVDNHIKKERPSASSNKDSLKQKEE